MKLSNPFWNFFASVKLALFTLGCIAVTSIIGTLIPQKESAQFYVNQYGTKIATYFQLLDFTDMYSSWWFLTLLGLLSINLIVCSIDRFPVTWKQITQNNLELPLERIEKFRLSASLISASSEQEVVANLPNMLAKAGWKAQSNNCDGINLFFCQKMPWSRIGVYFVHLSILIIFAGAVYGQLNGFRGSMMLPELQSSSTAFPFQSSSTINLGFTIRCDRFEIEFYDNNMPKEYRSLLTVLEDDQIILQKEIEVNTPLKYKGITFYQASYQPFNDFIFTMAEPDQSPINFTGEFQKEIKWSERNISFGIINLESVRDQAVRLKIWFNDATGEPSEFWVNTGEIIELQRGNSVYRFSAKQRYATGLQVAKDPGVWIVYIGFMMMISGLYIAFFMSHKRLWLIVKNSGTKTQIEIRGSTNKNQAGFTTHFQELTSVLAKELKSF